jgi:hypothetical protein
MVLATRLRLALWERPAAGRVRVPPMRLLTTPTPALAQGEGGYRSVLPAASARLAISA